MEAPRPGARAAGAERGGRRGAQDGTPARRGRAALVFVLDGDGAPQPLEIQIGITDGGYTELVAGDLTEAQQVITRSNEVEEIETPGRRRFGLFGF